MKRLIYMVVLCVAAAPAPHLRAAEPGGPRQPGGQLGELGVYRTVEGIRAEGGKVEVGTLLVDTVVGKKLDAPISVVVSSPGSPARRLDLPAKQRCVLKGYETGR